MKLNRCESEIEELFLIMIGFHIGSTMETLKDLSNLKRRELQALCKTHGIKANMKVRVRVKRGRGEDHCLTMPRPKGPGINHTFFLSVVTCSQKWIIFQVLIENLFLCMYTLYTCIHI